MWHHLVTLYTTGQSSAALQDVFPSVYRYNKEQYMEVNEGHSKLCCISLQARSLAFYCLHCVGAL